MQSKWQWIDNAFGPMGWFTNRAKARLEGTEGFTNGHWRPIGPEELAAANADIKRLFHEQA